MPLDQRFVGFWLCTGVSAIECEIKPAGDFIIQRKPIRYEISIEGTILTLYPSKGPEIFQRFEGTPKISLIGVWKRYHEDTGEMEVWDFKPDGCYHTYVEGGKYHHSGSYHHLGTSFQYQEPRGIVSTEGDLFRHVFNDNDIVFRYEFDGENLFHLYKLPSMVIDVSWKRFPTRPNILAAGGENPLL